MKRLNLFIISDVYFLPLQIDIIIAIQNCFYIFVIDCADFFYQWRVHSSDRHKLTIVNHRKQKSFNVAIMKYRNSSVYVQRQIDRFLRFCRSFVRIYINDVIIFFKIKKNHFVHLKKVFQIFRKCNISIKSIKIFFAYFSIQFLNQKMNSLKLIMNENKFRVISKLKFSITFRKLKHYLDLIDWFRKYVKNYAKMTKSLQNRKTMILKKSFFIDKSTRKSYSTKTALQNLIKKKFFFSKNYKKYYFHRDILFIIIIFVNSIWMLISVKKKHECYDLSFEINNRWLFRSQYDQINHVFEQKNNECWIQILIHRAENCWLDVNFKKNETHDRFRSTIFHYLHESWNCDRNQSSKNFVYFFYRQIEFTIN